MKSIDDLIAKYCPYGVEYKELWQLTIWDKKFNEVERDKQPTTISYHYFLADELEQMAVSGGTIKLLTTSPSNIFTSEEIADDKISEGEIVSIPWGGYPHVQYYKGRFLTADNRIATSRDIEVLDNKFLYYIMANRTRTINSFYRGSGIKHPSMARVLNLPIPLPHIEIQREIVRILDGFTGLIDELEAELAARLKQYKQYRKKLLAFGDDVEWKMLQDVCVIKHGSDYKRFGHGKYPVYGSGGIMTYVDRYAYDKPTVLLPRKGSLDKIHYVDHPFWNVDTVFYTEIDTSKTIPKFIYHYLLTVDLRRWSNVGGVPGLTQSRLNKIAVPHPSLPEQGRIVETLDKFDALCNDETSGLAAEIAARKKQYEYYRDKLLTFKRKAS